MLWSDKIHFLDMFRTSLGVKNEVFPKSFGDVWAIIWHHRRCQRRGLKIFSKTFFPKTIKVVQNFFLYILAPELNSDLFSRAVLCIFRFFHIFHFSPLAGSYIPLLGPYIWLSDLFNPEGCRDGYYEACA